MRTVVDNKTLAALWVAQSQPHAHSNSGSFTGTKLFSYGTVIAALIKSKSGAIAYLINETQYSNSTSTLRGIVINALPKDKKVFQIPGVDRYLSGNFSDRKRIMKALRMKRLRLLEDSTKSREPKQSRLKSDAQAVEQLAKEYAEFVA